MDWYNIMNSYVSCIKIGKQPIIPPLLTDETRQEMRHYRDLALAIDNSRKMKRNSTDSGVIISSSDASGLKNQPEISIRNESPDNVNSDDEEFVDATNQPVANNIFDDDKLLPIDSPRLERRNSYTLENPSPILLEYVRSRRDTDYKKCEIFIDFDEDDAEMICEIDDEQTEPLSVQNLVTNSSEKLCKNILVKASLDSPSSDHSSDSEQNIESIYNSFSTIADLGERSRDVSYCNDDLTELGVSGSSSFTLMTPSVYDINDSFNKDFQLLDLNASYESDAYDDSRYSEDSVSLSKYLTNEGEETEKNALEHMKKQLQIKHCEQFKQLLQEQQKEHDNLKLQLGRISSLSDKTTPSHYAYSNDVVLKKYSACGRNTESSIDSPGGTLSRNENTTKELPKICTVISKSNVYETKLDVPMLRKSKKSWTQEDREKAATRINALVRGFLTRRLLKTDYVVTLVQTIKDCLIQAVSLQNEPNLGLSELEFQSRILQQITVACNELHDVFSLSVDERMKMIAIDRKKKSELSLKKNKTPVGLSSVTKRTLKRKNLSKSASPPHSKFTYECRRSASSASESKCRCRTPSYRRLLASSFGPSKTTSQYNKGTRR